MRPEKILAILLPLLLLAMPALAQFELDPPKGYELGEEEYLGNLFAKFPPFEVGDESRPDIMIRYRPAAEYLFSWAAKGPGHIRQSLLGDHEENDGSQESQIDASLPILAIYGLLGNRIDSYKPEKGKPVKIQTVEFPPLSAEYIWLVDLTGDGRSEVVISGMTGISNGGGAFVFQMTDELLLEPVLEDYDDEDFPQMLWSFYGDMELLRTPEGKWVFKGISPVGRNLTDYFWSWFYEWDEDRGLFVTDGPSYKDEKQKQHDFYLRFQQVLGEFKDDPAVFAASDTEGEFSYGFHDETGEYSLDCFLDEDGSIMEWLVDEAISELDYLLAGPDAD